MMNAFQNLQPVIRKTMCSSSSRAFASRALMVAGMVGTAAPLATLCERKKGEVLSKDSNGNIDWSATLSRVQTPDFWDDVATTAGAKVQEAVDTGVPTSLSYGFVSGYCSGYALKKVGRAAATVFGLGFLVLQVLSYNGYIDVDHSKIKKEVENLMDLNNDGVVDDKDRAIATKKVMDVLQHQLPSGGGFVVGFIGGLRSG